MLKPLARVAAMSMLAAAVVGTTGLAASADDGDRVPAAKRHCTMDVVHHKVACFGTFREAIAHATAGKITDAPEDARAAMKDKRFADRVNRLGAATPRTTATTMSSTVISIEFWDTYHQGSTFTFTGTGPCKTDGNRDYEEEDIRYDDSNWNDKISSFQGYSSCQVNHYENSYFSGSRTGAKSSMSTMGVMDNETTSLTWG